MSISGISQMLLAWFWLNFKGRFLGLSLTDANCYGDICQGNICPGNICPYQKYISCYWSDFDQTFWTQFLGAFFGPRNLLYPKLFDLNSFWPDFFLPKFFSPNFLDLSFLTQFFPEQRFFEPKVFISWIFCPTPVLVQVLKTRSWLRFTPVTTRRTRRRRTTLTKIYQKGVC